MVRSLKQVILFPPIFLYIVKELKAELIQDKICILYTVKFPQEQATKAERESKGMALPLRVGGSPVA
jgi:hypothetical protein